MVSYSCLFRLSRKSETLGTWEGFRLPYSFLPSFARKLTDSESDHPSNTVHKITPLRAHDPTLKEKLNVNSPSIERKKKRKKKEGKTPKKTILYEQRPKRLLKGNLGKLCHVIDCLCVKKVSVGEPAIVERAHNNNVVY